MWILALAGLAGCHGELAPAWRPDALATTVAIGDLDCDGAFDLAAGAPGASRVDLYLTHGGALPQTPSQQLYGASRDEFFGQVIVLADVDGDTCADLIVASDASPTQVQLFLGSLDGADPTPSWQIAGGGFGAAIAAGDVNDDGFADIAVSSLSGGGSVRVFTGGTGGLTEAPDPYLGHDTRSEQFGAAVLIADMDRDNNDDLVVGDPFYDCTSDVNCGLVRIFLSDGNLPDTNPDWEEDGSNNVIGFGTSLAAGPVMGNNATDLVIGVANPDPGNATNTDGGVLLYRGRQDDVPETSDSWNLDGTNDEQLGARLAIGPDFTGDGRPDILIASTRFGAEAGRLTIYAFEGGQPNAPWWEQSGTNEGQFGSSLAVGSAADTTITLAVGSPNFQVGGNRVGRLQVFGASGGATPTSMWTVDGD